MTHRFRLAHLSDIHLPPLPRLPLRHMNVKRTLGLLNWHKSRRRTHLSDTLERIVADLHEQAVDHIAVTGDLINIGLPEEYATAERWLRHLGSSEAVTVVPGNHDIYTRLGDDPGVERWRDYIVGNVPLLADRGLSGGFPFVRRFGRMALIGLNSAHETRPFYAGGRLGAGQRRQLAHLLDTLASEGAIRVVLIHHPPLPGQAVPSKALSDADELAALLHRHGAELVLHGHSHVHSVAAVRPEAQRPTPVVGVASASLGRPHHRETLASYHIYSFDLGQPDVPPVMTIRGIDAPGGPVVALGERSLGLVPAPSG